MMIHGGDIYRNKVNIDFSVNSNPLGMPSKVRRALQEAVNDCGNYPDIQAEALVSGIERMTGVSKAHILCGNGASELFLAIVHAVKPKKTLLPVPSFFGYEYAAKTAEGEIGFYKMREEDGFCLKEEFIGSLSEDLDLVFLANPNNPVGNLIDDPLLKDILNICLERKITVILDECFIEFTGKEEIRSLKKCMKEYPNVIVVRSFTKIFAMPGVRLGYLLCGNSLLLERIKDRLPEWNLSAFAQAGGIQACEETDYIEATVGLIKRERQYMEDELRRQGITVFSSEADYLLVYSHLPLYKELLKRGILIRDCSNFRGLSQGYYRIAVKSHEENKSLINMIKEIKSAD